MRSRGIDLGMSMAAGSPHHLMAISALKTPRSVHARPANHGIGPVSLAVFHFDPKLFGGHPRHGPGRSGQTDFFPSRYRLFSGLFLRELLIFIEGAGFPLSRWAFTP